MTKADYTKEQLEEIEAALATAQETQTAFWAALRDLETAVGSDELDLDNNDLENYEVEDILAMVDDDKEEDDDKPGPCLTCGTQCDDEGICPICAALEQAEELIREATAHAKPKQKHLRAAYAAKEKALDASIDNCRKCGKPLKLRDVTQGDACTDNGDGGSAEESKVFVYCSNHCQETH